MPAAASENAPGKLFGASLANRRCSEWRVVIGKFDVPGKERKQSPASVSKPKLGGTKAPDGFRKGAWPAREVRPDGLNSECVLGTARRQEEHFRVPIRRLTGPHAGAVRREMMDASPNRCKAEKGISGSTDRTTGQGFAPEPVGPDAASIAMQVVPPGAKACEVLG